MGGCLPACLEEREVAGQGLLIPEGWCSQDNKIGCHGNQLPFQQHQPAHSPFLTHNNNNNSNKNTDS